MLHNGPVPGRSILLFVAALLIIAALASAIAPHERNLLTPTHTQATAPVVTAPVARVKGTLPADGTVQASVGDIVDLTVTAAQPDEAQIFALGLQAPVDADVPATFEFVADQPGTFPVTLRDAGTKAGTLVVRPAQ